MAIDLKSMSRKELMKLGSDVEKALKVAEERERSEARKAAEKAAAEYGFDLDEITGSGKRGTARQSKSQAKYRNPADHAQTWSGRGRKPNWVHEALAGGADITDLEI